MRPVSIHPEESHRIATSPVEQDRPRRPRMPMRPRVRADGVRRDRKRRDDRNEHERLQNFADAPGISMHIGLGHGDVGPTVRRASPSTQRRISDLPRRIRALLRKSRPGGRRRADAELSATPSPGRDAYSDCSTLQPNVKSQRQTVTSGAGAWATPIAHARVTNTASSEGLGAASGAARLASDIPSTRIGDSLLLELFPPGTLPELCLPEPI